MGTTIYPVDRSIFNNKLLAEWYCSGNGHAHVYTVRHLGKAIDIYCDGEMRIEYKGISIRNSEQFKEAGVYTDNDIADIDHLGGQWINNPWFDCYRGAVHDEHLDMVTHDLNDAINSAMVYLQDEYLNGEVNDN